MIATSHHALPPTPVRTLADHEARGGLAGLHTARSLDASEVIDLVAAAGVRGRGGAGFPTGRKWRSLREAAGPGDDLFVVVNAAEGEPGTFKDRALLRANPYLVLEGALIAAHALDARRVVLATKASYGRELAAIERAAGELAAAGQVGDVGIELVAGPDAYLFGEETALLEVIEGEDPLPRHIPPYLYGLYTTSPQLGWSAGIDESSSGPTVESHNPALVNNAETYAHVALVCRHGPDWYRSMGTAESPGPTIVTITGDVARATVAEVELGAPLGEVIAALSGGPTDGREIKAVLSGVSNRVLTAEHLAATVSYEGLRAVGSGLGSAGFVVYDERRNAVDIAYQVSHFLHVESCGQCNPCKTGTGDITVALERLVRGDADVTRVERTLVRRLATVTDGSRCFLPTQERTVVPSLLEAFPDDLLARLSGVPGDLDLVLPRPVDLVDGVAVQDPRAGYKRPDWTYAETPVRLAARV